MKLFVRVIVCFALLFNVYSAIAGEVVNKTTGNVYSSLQEALKKADANSQILVKDGSYKGNFTVDKPLTLLAQSKNTILDAEGVGIVVNIRSDDVKIEGFTITGSGPDVSAEDAGIYVAKNVKNTQILNNNIVDNLFGISLHGAYAPKVIGNTITGRLTKQMTERGDGMRIWRVDNGIIKNNHFYQGRDGIFITISTKNKLIGNTMDGVRFAIHYMYADNNEVAYNISRNNTIGYALMFSSKLNVHHNSSENDGDHGIMFNFTNYSTVQNNSVKSAKGKCTFLYNSNYNTVSGNHFEGCGIGVHYTAGSKHNQIYANNFIANQVQVKYVGTKHQQWSKDGIGNYWSEHSQLDFNGDGIADLPYRPNNITDQLVWKFPAAKMLVNSPAFQLINWSQRQFPTLYPGGVEDSYPSVTPYKHPIDS